MLTKPVIGLAPTPGNAREASLSVTALAEEFVPASQNSANAVAAAVPPTATSTIGFLRSFQICVQQEVTRATRPFTGAGLRAGVSPIRNFGVGSSVLTAVILIASGPAWIGAVFPRDDWAFMLPIAIGGASYVVVAVICGSLYGLSLWRAVALMSACDGILRLTGVLVVVAVSGGIGALVWAVVLPFPLTPLILWWFIRRDVVGRAVLDVGYGVLTWNVLRTVVASVVTGIMISGFPLLLKATSPGASDTALGALIFAINLVRAPLVIVVLSLQSYLVVRFRNAPERALALFARLAVLVVAAAVVLAAIAWFLVPPILDLFRRGYGLDGPVVAGLVGTAGLLGVLCLSGPLALARSQHAVFTAGWVGGAVVSVLMLLVPGDLATRMLLSLALGPLLGASIHIVGVLYSPRRSAQAD